MRNKLYAILGREQIEVNTDPQRRFYNGCHAKSEMRWTEWGVLGHVHTLADAEDSVSRWKGIGRPSCEYKFLSPEVNSTTQYEGQTMNNENIQENIQDWTMDKLRRKARQEWDMAGCARQDGDRADEVRRTAKAKEYDAEISRRLRKDGRL